MKSDAFIYLGGSFPQLEGLIAVKRSGLHVVLIDRDKTAQANKLQINSGALASTIALKFTNGLRPFVQLTMLLVHTELPTTLAFQSRKSTTL